MDMYIIIKKPQNPTGRILSIAAWTKRPACDTIMNVKLSSL